MSSIPQDLEPGKGDYVRYIEELQAGKIKELSGVRAGVVTQSDSGLVQVKSGRQLQQEEQMQAQAVVRQRIERTRIAMGMIGPAILLIGIGCFSYGIAYEVEDVIPVGMVMMFIGFVATAKFKSDSKKGR